MLGIGIAYGDPNECLDGLAHSIIGALTDKVICSKIEGNHLLLLIFLNSKGKSNASRNNTHPV